MDVLVPALATVGTDDTQRVYTKAAANAALDTKVNVNGNNLQLPTFVEVLAKGDGINGIYTKKGVNDELAKKADTSAIPLVPDLSNYLETSNLVKEVAKKPVVEAIFDLEDSGAKISETKIGATFAKIDGSNATKDGVNDMLDKLTDKVVKTSKLAEEVAKKPVVEAIFDLEDSGAKISETKIGATFAKIDGSNATKDGVNDMLDKLTDKVVKTSKLAEEVAKKPVVEAIFDLEDSGAKISETKIGATFAKIDGTNIDKDFAGKVFDAKDDKKLVLVEKLGEFLGSSDQAMYDGQNEQTAQVFLVGKGLKGDKGDPGNKGEDGKSPSAGEIAAEPALQTAVATNPALHTAVAGNQVLQTAVQAHVAKINIKSPEFRSAVQDEISQPYFDIPADDSAPISTDW